MTNPLAQDLGGVVLLPCPWCGRAARIKGNSDWWTLNVRHKRSCILRDSQSIFVPRTNEQRALLVKDWNTRANSAEIAGALRDAERLDWMAHHGASLRNEPGEGWFVLAPYHTGIPSVDGRIRFPTARTAIDSAMQQGGGG